MGLKVPLRQRECDSMSGVLRVEHVEKGISFAEHDTHLVVSNSIPIQGMGRTSPGDKPEALSSDPDRRVGQVLRVVTKARIGRDDGRTDTSTDNRKDTMVFQ